MHWRCNPDPEKKQNYKGHPRYGPITAGKSLLPALLSELQRPITREVARPFYTDVTASNNHVDNVADITVTNATYTHSRHSEVLP